MPFYETVFIARQELSDAQVKDLTESYAKIITDGGGKIHKTENWGLRTLAYRIRKNRKGHYVLIESDTPPAALLEMERQMRINEDVLRFLTVRVDDLPGDVDCADYEQYGDLEGTQVTVYTSIVAPAGGGKGAHGGCPTAATAPRTSASMWSIGSHGSSVPTMASKKAGSSPALRKPCRVSSSRMVGVATISRPDGLWNHFM